MLNYPNVDYGEALLAGYVSCWYDPISPWYFLSQNISGSQDVKGSGDNLQPPASLPLPHNEPFPKGPDALSMNDN